MTKVIAGGKNTKRGRPDPGREIEELRDKVRELEQTLDAIRSGEVDAIIVAKGDTQQIYTLDGADHPYQVLVENIQEGVLTISCAGMILYTNSRFAEMVKLPIEDLPGTPVLDYICPEYCPVIDNAMRAIQTRDFKGQARIRHGSSSLPVYITLTALSADENTTISVVITDRSFDEEQILFQATMLDAVGDAVVALDTTKKIIYWNDAATKTYGWKRNEVLGSNFVELTESTVSQEEIQVITKLLEKGESWSGEYYVRHRDGYWFPIFANSSPVFDDNKNLLAVINASHDITERKLAEVSLKESEARYRHLVMSAPAAIYEISADGNSFKYVNDAMCHILGYSQEELLEMNPFNILDEESKVRFQERVKKRLSGEDIDESVAYKIIGRDGRVIWATLNIRLNNDGEGGTLVVAHDITERRAAEEKLLSAYILTSSILDSINGSFIALDKNWQFTYINQRATIPDFSPEDLIGKSIWEVFTEIVGTPLETLYREVMASREPKVYENKSEVASGNYFELHVYPIGESGLAIFGQDITDRKKSEAELRDAHLRTNTILESVADTFYSLDNQWRFTTINPAAEKAPFGRPASELLGRVIWDLYPNLVGTRIQQHYLDAAEKHTLEHYEALSPLDGQWYEVFMQGRVEGVDIYMRDITSRKVMEEELRESEKKYKELVETANSVIIQMDSEGKISFFNNYAQNFFGYTLEEILGQNVKILVPVTESGTGRNLETMVNAVIKDPDSYTENINENVKKNGDRVWISWRNSALRDLLGNITGNLAIGQDITERISAEKALKKSEENLLRAHELLESVTKGTEVIIAVQDTDYHYLYFNDAYKEEIKRLTGKAITLGTSMVEVFADLPKEQKKSIDEWSRVLNGVYVNEKIEFGSNGKERKVYHVLHTPIRDEHGRITAAGEVAFDITKQVEIEDALRETKEYLDNLITYANAPIIVWDPQFRITLFNRAFEHLTGRKAKDVIGEGLEILLPEKYLNKSIDRIIKTGEGERWESVEIPILHKKGEIRTVLWNSAAIWGSDGKTIISTIAQGQDITERKKIESEYRLKATEYAKMNVALQEEILQRKSIDADLKKTLSLLNASLESTADGILVVDREGTVTSYNQNFVTMWNIPSDIVKTLDNKKIITHFQTQIKDPGGFLTNMNDLHVHPARESYDMIELKDGRIFERYSKPQKIGKDVVGRVWSFRDITDRKRSEENLIASLQEKEVLLREIHHRVKNNLQLISGLLDMTRMRTQDDITTGILTDMMLKIQTMAQIHTRLYESKQFGKIGLTGHFRDQVAALSNIYSHHGHEISCEIHAEEIYLPVDQALPCALVINEILSNSYKHAFKGKKHGTINVFAMQENANIRITVKDDGIGFPPDFDIGRTSSLGMKLVQTLVKHQLKGSLHINSQHGTEMIVEFPLQITRT